MKIILIEDEGSLRDLYKREFETQGFTLEGFATGKEGLEALGKNQYDAMLLDIMLPDISGIEVLKKVKETEGTKTMPVVLLTNLGQDTVIKQGFSLGAEGYLVKAYYSTKEIVEEVKKILQEKHPELFNSNPAS